MTLHYGAHWHYRLTSTENCYGQISYLTLTFEPVDMTVEKLDVD